MKGVKHTAGPWDLRIARARATIAKAKGKEG